MNTFIQISLIFLSLFFMWRIYKIIKHNPEVVSRENITKSFGTMGVLSLILIGFVAMMVLMLRG